MARVTSESSENLQVLIRTSDHELLADEPAGLGDGLGPDPYELLLSALAACTTMTLKLYARRKGWDLQRVEVDLSHDRVHAADCKECEQTEGKVERIVVRLKIEGDLTDEQRTRIREIAQKCPVHKTLTGGATILHETWD
ncbi:MAG: OsmC family protein [Acidobacteria bacterium]|nr:OsmC family protein [Acidobacteriota bacterium]MDA1235581.1 OsmC family protein [Acidobacteriota bacterium]